MMSIINFKIGSTINVSTHIRIGTRGSKLALAQANLVKQLLQEKESQSDIEIVTIESEGDQDQSTPLSELGGKGVFIKAIEAALMCEEVDIAVHSLKDVTTELAVGSQLAAYLPAESVADTLCLAPQLNTIQSIETLPLNAVVATGSLRRKAQLLHYRPDVSIVPIRGNIDTRLKKLANKEVDAIMLSEAGLIRLNYQQDYNVVLNPITFIPAPGQGVIVVQARMGDPRLPFIQSINHHHQAQVSELELAIVRQLGFDCQYPLGLYAQYQSDHFLLSAFNAHPKTLEGRYLTATIPLDYTAADLDEVIIDLIE